MAQQQSKLSESQKQALYTQYCNGEKVADLAPSFGVSEVTAYKYIRRIREAKEGAPKVSKEKVIAGDRKHGRLVSLADPHRYEGTCIVNGKSHSKTFVTVNAKKAEEMWRKWCDELRDEQTFMDMVERKPKSEPQPLEDIVPVEPAPTPVIEVRPWREVAEERQKRIEELEARVAELEEKPVASGPVYVLWAKTDNPKLYGAYLTMEHALKELDRLNDVAAFLGNESAFEVEEVAWR